MRIDPTERSDMSRLADLLGDFGTKLENLEKNVQVMSAQILALKLDMPVPLQDFKPGAGDGAVASPLAGTDPMSGGPEGGAGNGGAGHGVTDVVMNKGDAGPGHK